MKLDIRGREWQVECYVMSFWVDFSKHAKGCWSSLFVVLLAHLSNLVI